MSTKLTTQGATLGCSLHVYPSILPVSGRLFSGNTADRQLEWAKSHGGGMA